MRTSDAVAVHDKATETSPQEVEHCFAGRSSSDTDHLNAVAEQFAELSQHSALDGTMLLKKETLGVQEWKFYLTSLS